MDMSAKVSRPGHLRPGQIGLQGWKPNVFQVQASFPSRAAAIVISGNSTLTGIGAGGNDLLLLCVPGIKQLTSRTVAPGRRDRRFRHAARQAYSPRKRGARSPRKRGARGHRPEPVSGAGGTRHEPAANRHGSGTFTRTTAHSKETDAITGGTGRFAGANGTYKDTISFVQDSHVQGTVVRQSRRRPYPPASDRSRTSSFTGPDWAHSDITLRQQHVNEPAHSCRLSASWPHT
jgi:hypothetical protein